MKFLNENAGVFVLIFGILVVIGIVWTIIQNHRLTKNLVTKKFDFTDGYEIDRRTGEKYFTVVIANKTVNDATLTDVGFKIGDETFSFFEEFRLKNFLTQKDKVVIYQRSSVKMKLGIEEVESAFFKYKRGKKIEKIRVYVTDSSGSVVVGRARTVRRIVKEDYKDMLRVQRLMRIESDKAECGHAKFGDVLRELFSPKLRRTPPVIVDDTVAQDTQEECVDVTDKVTVVEAVDSTVSENEDN